MKKAFGIAVLVMLSLFLVVPAATAGELEVFVNSLNVEARADLGGFRADLAARFGVPGARVDVILRDVDNPADAYMCLRIGEIAHVSTEVVLREYHAHKDKGWGAIAKSLGIKPGSREFHALKDGYSGHGPRGKGKGKKHKG